MMIRSKFVRRLLVVLVVLGALGFGAYKSTPSVIRWYVAKHYPYVQLRGAVEPVWGGLVLRDVKVTRPGVTATLTKVHISMEKRVTVEGGKVTVDLDERKKGSSNGSTGGIQLSASDLTVDVRASQLSAHLEEVSVDSQHVTFVFGKATYRQVEVSIWKGSVRRDKTAVDAERVEVPVRIPFDLPRVGRDQVITVSKPSVQVADKVVRFQSATMGPFSVMGPATVKVADLDDEGIVFFDAPSVHVDHPWVAPYPAHFKKVGVVAPLSVVRTGKGQFRVTVGGATLRLDPEHYAVDGSEDCGDWLDILPHPLPEALQQMQGNFKGRLSFEVRAKPVPHLSIEHDCSYTCSAEPVKTLRQSTFTYMAYDRNNKLFERKTGRLSPGWISIADLPTHVPQAFVLLEDPGFFSHKGIHVMALENSLKANLEKGEFVKGGSTISMQLSKNLWLKRHKTIGRKAYEALLTVAMESCMSKAQILELYMNVVEYAPDVYGIGPATQHYFRKPAQQLETDEAYFLAKLLPHPKRTLSPNGGGLASARKLMRRLAVSGYISEHIIPPEDNEVLDTEGWEALD